MYKIIETRHLVQKQNKFDDLKEDAKNRGQEKVLLVPTPTQVFNAVVYKEKEAELMRLQNLLDQVSLGKPSQLRNLLNPSIFTFRRPRKIMF